MERKKITKKAIIIASIILLLIVAVIILSVLFIKEKENNSISTSSTTNINIKILEKDLQAYHNDITVFQSVEKNNIIIECNFEDSETESEKEYKIGEIIGQNLSGLSTYNNIELNLNIKNSKKIILNINPKTKEVDEQIQTLILEGSEEQNKIQNEINELKTQKENLEKEIATLTETKTKATSAQDIVLIAGKYVVGEDINAGKYDIIAQSGHGNIYIKGSTSVIETMGTTGDRLTNYNNITLKSGDTIELTGTLKVKFQAK